MIHTLSLLRRQELLRKFNKTTRINYKLYVESISSLLYRWCCTVPLPAALEPASPPKSSDLTPVARTLPKTHKKKYKRKAFIGSFQAYEEDVVIESISLKDPLGIAKLADGSTVQVPFVLTGEKVRVRVYKRDERGTLRAHLLSVIKSSPERVKPLCPLHGQCTGCQFQHWSYEKQLAWKHSVITALFPQYPISCMASTSFQYGYRTKLTPHFNEVDKTVILTAKKAAEEEGETLDKHINFPIGLLDQEDRVVDISHCALATPMVNDGLTYARKRAKRTIESFERGAALLIRDNLETLLQPPQQPIVKTTEKGSNNSNLHASSVDAHPKHCVTDSREIVTEHILGTTFQFQAGMFFQNNRVILGDIASHVIDMASDNKRCSHLIDAYCGCGLFALISRHHFDKAIGIEINGTCIKWARSNAKLNKAENCTFVMGDANDMFKSASGYPSQHTAVIIDPPRKGCGIDFMKQLQGYRSRRVVYVSCNPETQARDAAVLLDNGYKIVSIQPYDMFPNTKHIECVMTLERKDFSADDQLIN